MNFKSILHFVVGIASSFVGAFLSLGAIINLTEGKEESVVGWLAMVFLLGVMPMGLGAYLIKKSTQIRKTLSAQNEHMTEQLMERKILQVAAELGGKVTPSEIALKTHISLDKAHLLLQNMQEGGYAELEITQTGAIIYHFRGFLSDDDRQNTMGLLD
jgi:uncharacterized membrane protein